jgi:two-component system, NarL family, nitrate/nitrite response regulator NarL
MRLLVIVETRVYRDGLARLLGQDERFDVVGVVASLEEALARLKEVVADIILLDMPMPAGANAVRALLAAAPQVKVVAVGVSEAEGDVIAFAEAGASGYVPQEGSVEDHLAAIESVSRGETLCSPGIAAALFQRVAALAREHRLEPIDDRLTARELEVLRLLEGGSSNKEIARALSIELPTVKNHVHRILEKLNVHRRTEAAARARRHGFPHLDGLGPEEARANHASPGKRNPGAQQELGEPVKPASRHERPDLSGASRSP